MTIITIIYNIGLVYRIDLKIHVNWTIMSSKFENIPCRIFLDSSILQALQDYGAFLYENGPLSKVDPIYRDPKGIAKLETLRHIMQISERAPFQFALSRNSFVEVQAKRDTQYLQWAYDGDNLFSILIKAYEVK